MHFLRLPCRFLLIVLTLVPSVMAQPSQEEAVAALHDMANLNGFSPDPDLMQRVQDFYALPGPTQLSASERETLFENRSIALWSGSLHEFLALSDLLIQDHPAEEAAAQGPRYQKASAILKDLETSINAYVFAIHPGYQGIDAEELRAGFSGRGVRIAVFDVFDRASLARQKESYPAAIIHPPLEFGRPVELNHGNTVIDVILTLAPAAEIIPVSSDSANYNQALEAIVARPDIDIVNMSRAFAAAKDHGGIDPAFKRALRSLVKTRILVKSLGNTGSDLDLRLNPRRQAEGLGPLNNLFAYDLSLIKDLYTEGSPEDLLLFAMNLSLFGSDIARSATIPGAFSPVASRTLALPAEGVWSPSSGTFESGSSFAAPQLAALCALLLEARRASGVAANDQEMPRVIQALKRSADRRGQSSEVWGLGLASGDGSLRDLP